MRALLNELWAGVEQVQAMKRRERGAMGSGGNGNDSGAEWQVVDSEGLQRIANVRSFYFSEFLFCRIRV
jgi:hypothetical protein